MTPPAITIGAMARTARQLLALRVRMLRRTRGWSQEELAAASGLHRTYVGGIERAERNCTLEVLASLAAALDVSPAELLVHPQTEVADEVQETAPDYDPVRSGVSLRTHRPAPEWRCRRPRPVSGHRGSAPATHPSAPIPPARAEGRLLPARAGRGIRSKAILPR